MRKNYNDKIENIKNRMDSNNYGNISQQFRLKDNPSYFMFSQKNGYMGNGAMPMSNFLNDQDFASMGNSHSNIVGA